MASRDPSIIAARWLVGLATVDRLVRAHNGTVGVRSRVGAGSTFWFELPELELAPRPVAVPAMEPAHV